MNQFLNTICIVLGRVLSDLQPTYAQDKLVLDAEFGLPLYQNYKRIFMDTDYAFTGISNTKSLNK